jgi:membrane protein DedA with SNARE-associated domain
MSFTQPAERAPQSSFVTGVASVVLVFAVLGVLGAQDPQVPQSEAQLEGLFLGWVAVALLVSAFAIWASWALLQRRNWARIAFLAFGALNVVASALFALGLGLVAVMMGELDLGQAQSAVGLVRVACIGLAVLGGLNAAVTVWVVARLASARVRAEFEGARSRAASVVDA